MKIGLPEALLYHRYGVMWKIFFEELGCEVITSGDTNKNIAESGIFHSTSECCLPAKVYLGHVASLQGRCDRVLVPRFERVSKGEEFCVRFWGLPDIVRATFPGLPILTYNLKGDKPFGQLRCFLGLGDALKKSRADALIAYHIAKKAQRLWDAEALAKQLTHLGEGGLKVLIVSQPYIIHDRYIGSPVLGMLKEGGATPIFADNCERKLCRLRSKELSRDLYWTINKEIIGAAALHRDKVDGVLFITSFPCGTDSLAFELALRRIRGIPAAHIVLDEQQGEAGLRTRIECFLDILREGRRTHAS